jgi:hypothetical protein
MNKFRFRTVEPDTARGDAFDLAIACLGFESRAPNVCRVFFSKARRRVALGFDRQKVLHFLDNKRWFEENGVEVFGDVSDEGFQPTVESFLDAEGLVQDGILRIAIDVSCFDRFRLAVLCQVMLSHVQAHKAEVSFYYGIAAYDPPEPGFSINARLQPVHPSFVGTRPDPLAGTTAVIGLGYEREKALGAAEYLEANDVFTYCPSSSIEEYLSAVQGANELLLSQLPDDHRFIYEVEQPAKLVSELSSVVNGLMSDSAVIFIPLGPKMFALCCMLTASMFPSVSVWRMSQGSSAPPQDRRPTEHFSILKVSV